MNLNVVGQLTVNGQVFNVVDASVTYDRGNVIRRIASVTVLDPSPGTAQSIVPPVGNTTALFAPFGNEIELDYGLLYSDGTTELIRQGVFGIEGFSVNPSPSDVNLTLTVSDRARSYQRAGFQDVYTVNPNVDVAGEIIRMLLAVQVGFSPNFNFASTFPYVTPSTPAVFAPGDDPWAAATALATSAGCELFHDPNGVCLLQSVPNPQTQAVSWNYDDGANNIALDITRNCSRTGASNFIVRDGQGSGVAVPVRGIASDTNTASGTFVGGSYGVQVDYSTSTLVNTQPQAQAQADADLLTDLGSIETITLEAIPKPDHDVDDVIEVTCARAGIPSGSLYVVDSGTLGFGANGTLTLTGRYIGGILPPVTG